MNTLSEELSTFLKSAGADISGFADLGEVSVDARDGLPRGIAVAVALPARILPAILEGPTAEYYAEYRRINLLLDSLSQQGAHFLQKRGYAAQACAATEAGDSGAYSTRLPHKTVATRAGLGWIGKCALLVTEPFGSAVRLTSILTDADIETAAPINKSRCGDCIVCVEACPTNAPSGRNWRLGLHRDMFFDPRSCRKAARKLALERISIHETLCGICISRCPWTQRYAAKEK